MKKNLLKTICIAMVALLCVGSLNAQNAPKGKLLSLQSIPTDQTQAVSSDVIFDFNNTEKNPKEGGTLSWCGNFKNPLGSTLKDGEGTYQVGARFTKEDLVEKGVKFGDSLKTVRFVVSKITDDTVATLKKLTIFIYQGSTSLTSPGVQVHEQEVPLSKIVDKQWSEVGLSKPVVIDNSKELWITYKVVFIGNNGRNWSAFYDVGPNVFEKGDMILWSGTQWNTFKAMSPTSSANWNIEGYFVPGKPIPCDPVTDFSVELLSDCKAVLSWKGHSEAASYSISRNGGFLATVPAAVTSYTDAFYNASIANIWEIKVNCKNQGNSPSKDVNVGVCMNCPQVKNLLVSYVKPEDCNVDLSWEDPKILTEGVVTYADTASMKGRIGGYSTGESDMTACIRLTPVDFEAFGILSDQVITHVFFAIGDSISKMKNMQIRIWEGGTSLTNPGPEIVTQNFTANWTDEDDFGVIELAKPHTINTTKELRIGWRVVIDPKTGPFIYDAGPVAENKGDVILLNGAWKTVQNSYNGINANLVIAAIVEKGEAVAPERTYNIYRDNLLIKPNFVGNTYRDDAGNFDNTASHTWMVRANCLVAGQSIPSLQKLKECIVGISEPEKVGFNIVPNPARDNITIKASNDFNRVEIINFLGQTVITQSNEGFITNVNVSNLTSGVYFVRIITETGTSVQKFVKQ